MQQGDGAIRRIDPKVAAALVVLAGAFLFVGLDRYGVVNGDEGIYHAIAERMVATGDWLHLDFRGERRVYDTFMNAPLHYWTRAGLISVFGSSLFTMRALSALFGVLTVLATYALGCRLAGRRAGAFAAAVQLTTFQFVYLHGARTGELDTIASCLITVSCLCFLRAVEEERSFIPHHLAVYALLMTKLPLTIVPIGVELAWLALHPTTRRHLPRYVKTGFALLPLGLAWHVGQAIHEREHLAGVLSQMFGVASGASADGARLGLLGNLRFYASTLLYGALPWAAAYPFAALLAFGRDAAAARLRTPLVYVGVVLLLFGLVSKNFPWYVMPAYPFLAVLVGAWLDTLWRDGPGRAGAALGAVGATLLWVGVSPLSTNPFAERALVIPMELVARGWLGLSPPLAIAIVGSIWGAAWLGMGDRLSAALRLRIGQAAVVALLAFALLRVWAPLAHLDHQSPLDRVHARIEAAKAAGEPVQLPIQLGNAPPQIARFLFAEDFEIVTYPTPRGTGLALRERGDPKVLERSIGRAGLEWRFEQARQREAEGAP